MDRLGTSRLAVNAPSERDRDSLAPLRAWQGGCRMRAVRVSAQEGIDQGCGVLLRANQPRIFTSPPDQSSAPVALQRRSCWRRPPRLRRASNADVVREACDEIHSSYHDFCASASSDIPLSSKAAFAGRRNGCGVAATLQIASIRTRNARASRSN
jgi:hypothetical protein